MTPASYPTEAIIYTDGSCHTQKRYGAWVAIIFFEGREINLQGDETNTTHQQMELLAVIKAIEYVYNNTSGKVVMKIFTDSQYVVGLPAREQKLLSADFITKKGRDLQNAALVKSFYRLLKGHPVELKKVKAHQPGNGAVNYNKVADQMARGIVRAFVK